MGQRNARVDVYIESSAEFARPILRHLREAVHAACPQVEEAIKWSFPHFVYHGNLYSMAAFKQHATFGFNKGALFVAAGKPDEAMGEFGRITKLSELPAKKALAAYVKQAMALNEQGVKLSRKASLKLPLRVPADLAAALKTDAKARATFAAFPPSHRREYVEWITEAKRDETRQRRLVQTINWLAEGKPRYWKYADC